MFATKLVEVGTRLPVKGPWFESVAEVNEYLAKQHVDNATMMSTRVVRLDLVPGPQDKDCSQLFKAITCPVGFVNHFKNLAEKPNCQLRLLEGAPLGEHNLVLEATKPIKEGNEWLMKYGPLHPCGERKSRKRERPAAAGRNKGNSDPMQKKKKRVVKSEAED